MSIHKVEFEAIIQHATILVIGNGKFCCDAMKWLSGLSLGCQLWCLYICSTDEFLIHVLVMLFIPIGGICPFELVVLVVLWSEWWKYPRSGATHVAAPSRQRYCPQWPQCLGAEFVSALVRKNSPSNVPSIARVLTRPNTRPQMRLARRFHNC